MYLTRQPDHPPDDLREEIDGLRQQIAELELQPAISLDSIEHSQLLILARDTVSDGETVYAQSVAGGSEFGGPNETNSSQEGSAYAWLHRQVFNAGQQVVRGGDSTTTLPSPNHDLARNTDQDRWDRAAESAALEEPDYELELERSMISTLLDGSRVSFEKGNYHDARLRLQTATAAIHELPSISPGSYDFFELQYMLSVATFYATERKTAQAILLDFVRQQATSDHQRFCIAHASQLLAEAYISLGKLEAAKSSCANALRIRHCLPCSDQLAKDQCYALVACIETLLGNDLRSETLAYNVSSENRDACTRHYLDLSVAKSFSAERRYALPLKEKKLFQGYRVIKDTGRLEEIFGEAAQKSRSQTKMTPLHFAVMFRDTDYASVLIEGGADVNAEAAFGSADAPGWHTGDGLTPLTCALLIRHKDIARLLVSKGASLSLPSASRAHAVACLFGMPYELDSPPCSIASMFACIKKLGWDPDFVLDNTGQTLLHTAAQIQDVDLTEVLLDLGADRLIKDKDAHIPLQIALASKRNIARRQRNMDMLLERERPKQLDSRDKEGRTALHCVLAENDTSTAAELAQYLTAHGSDPLAKDRHEDIPLNVAIRHHGADFDLQILLRKKPREQLSSKDYNGQTPLQIALARGPAGESIVEALLEAGAEDHMNPAM
jgi:ankyrin repeat protein